MSDCEFCGKPLRLCEAGMLCAQDCESALMDAEEAFHDFVRPDGSRPDFSQQLRAAIRAFTKATRVPV